MKAEMVLQEGKSTKTKSKVITLGLVCRIVNIIKCVETFIINLE